MVRISTLSVDATATVRVDLADVPDVSAPHHRNTVFGPTAATLSFRQVVTRGGRWDDFAWTCTTAILTGPRVLQPGRDGERRTGAIVKGEWTALYGRDLTQSALSPAPEWLTDVINEVRPSGTVTA